MRIFLVGELRSALPGGQGGHVGTADIGIEDGQEVTPTSAAEDFVDSAGLAHIEMIGVDHGHVLLPAPETAHRQSQDTQDHAGALKGLDGGQLLGQELRGCPETFDHHRAAVK
jgi:hypothetical protein